MGFFRREKPIHEELAAEAGLDIDGSGDELASAPAGPPPREGAVSVAALLFGPRVAEDLLAAHGFPRPREYDEVASAQAPELPGESLEFLALPDGSLFVDDELPEGALDPLADTLSVPPPYHAFAERQDGSIWTVAARRTSVVEVTEEVPGDEVDMAVNEDERSVHVDGAEFDGEIPSLEDFAAQQFGSFVLRASRLDETLWEVTVLPL